MRPSSPPPSPPPDTLARSLDRLAAALDVGHDGMAPVIVRIIDDPSGTGDDVEVGLLPLEAGDHPLEFLAGFTAPAEWDAIGVVATGRARSLDGGPATRVRTVHLVTRDGAWLSRWTPLDAEAELTGGSSSSLTDGGTPCGRVDDALRLALGLRTAPPAGGTERLWAVQWLDAVVAEAVASPGRRRRVRRTDGLVSRHPAVAALGLDPAELTLERLVDEGARLAEWRDWAGLRQACAGGLWVSEELDAATAAWLDDGAFARWELAGWPELHELAEAAGSILGPETAAFVDQALAAWHLLPPRVPSPDQDVR